MAVVRHLIVGGGVSTIWQRKARDSHRKCGIHYVQFKYHTLPSTVYLLYGILLNLLVPVLRIRIRTHRHNFGQSSGCVLLRFDTEPNNFKKICLPIFLVNSPKSFHLICFLFLGHRCRVPCWSHAAEGGHGTKGSSGCQRQDL
jgi:hypothetical protein